MLCACGSNAEPTRSSWLEGGSTPIGPVVRTIAQLPMRPRLRSTRSRPIWSGYFILAVLHRPKAKRSTATESWRTLKHWEFERRFTAWVLGVCCALQLPTVRRSNTGSRFSRSRERKGSRTIFQKVLIANRGEIALRINRACQELGVRTVAIFSEADRESLHVRQADEAFCVGPGPVPRSYLNIPNIISTALVTGCDAIHPGYGFLAENARFAEICADHGLTFIGPKPSVISAMGDKATAKRVMKDAGVATTPGTDILESAEIAVKAAKKVGYPVILKATAGGGGKGMRV